MVALLTIECGVRVTEPREALERKFIVRALGFLEADHIRLYSFDELRYQADAQAHRIDVPGRDLEIHAQMLERVPALLNHYPQSEAGLVSVVPSPAFPRLRGKKTWRPAPSAGNTFLVGVC